jgi:WD40 repeat protein
VTLWRSADQSVVGELHGPVDEVDALAFSHDGRLLVATGNAPETVVWDVPSRRIVRRFGPVGQGGASGAAISPDDRVIATAGVDGVLRAYDIGTGRKIGAHKTKGSLQDVDFSPDGTLIATAGLAGDITIWNVKRRALQRTIRHTDAVIALGFSPDGKTIATGDLPGNVEFWNPSDGRKVGPTLGGHNSLVLSLSFSPSGTQLVTTAGDGLLRLWDVASGKLIGAPLPASEARGSGLYSPDGKHLIAAFDSGVGVVWNVDPRAWERQACRVAHRNLTAAEWRDLLPHRTFRPVCP